MNQRGFTLIELISVMLILGILLVVVVPRFMSFSDDAEHGVLISVIDKLNTQEKMAFLDCKMLLDQNCDEYTAPAFDTLMGLTLNKNDDGGVVVFDGGGTYDLYRWTTPSSAAIWKEQPQPPP